MTLIPKEETMKKKQKKLCYFVKMGMLVFGDEWVSTTSLFLTVNLIQSVCLILNRLFKFESAQNVSLYKI